MQVNEQNMLSMQKKLQTDMKAMTLDLSEVKQAMRLMKEQTELIIRELKQSAKKEEVAVLEKYIRLWEPLNFVTRAELEKALKK